MLGATFDRNRRHRLQHAVDPPGQLEPARAGLKVNVARPARSSAREHPLDDLGRIPRIGRIVLLRGLRRDRPLA